MLVRKLMTLAVRLIPFRMRHLIRKIPGVAGFQRVLVDQTLSDSEFVHRVDAGPAAGIRFQIKMPDDKGIWTGTYESDFAEILADNVHDGDIAFDIGSWHGFFAGVMAAQGAREVHAFEPLPRNGERIAHLVRLNPGKKIVLHQVAVGDKEGEMELEILPEDSMARLSESRFKRTASAGRAISVKLISIDQFVADGESPPPDVIKIDVEGAEMLVLNGARKTIEMHRPRLFIEVHSSELLDDCERFFELVAYRVQSLDEDPRAAIARDVFQIAAVPNET